MRVRRPRTAGISTPAVGFASDLALAQRAAADRSQRKQSVANSGGVQPAGDQAVDQALNVTGADILQLRRANRRIHVFPERLLVAAQRRGLIASPERFRIAPSSAAANHASPISRSFVGRGATSTQRRRSTRTSSRQLGRRPSLLNVFRTRRWSRWLHADGAERRRARALITALHGTAASVPDLDPRSGLLASCAWRCSTRVQCRPWTIATKRTVSVGLHPATELGDRDQPSATTPNDPELVHDVFFEEVDADAERLRRFALRHREARHARLWEPVGKAGLRAWVAMVTAIRSGRLLLLSYHMLFMFLSA